ncbi:MAG TPA: hypothetical protein VGN07_01530 [Steroidobacteraceae bacterium]|jgi:hypothetical protein
MNAPTQLPSEKKFFERTHHIARAVTPEGDPLYVLYENNALNTPFGWCTTTKKLAENRDRNVLEQAIRFIEVGE